MGKLENKAFYEILIVKNSAHTWETNSRVGATIQTWPIFLSFIFDEYIRLSAGSRYANVFPEPVAAWRIQESPEHSEGKAAIWIGDGEFWISIWTSEEDKGSWNFTPPKVTLCEWAAFSDIGERCVYNLIEKQKTAKRDRI